VADGSSSVFTSVCNAFPVWSRARRVSGRKSRASAPLIGLRREAPWSLAAAWHFDFIPLIYLNRLIDPCDNNSRFCDT
jgi:hypothetical protein